MNQEGARPENCDIAVVVSSDSKKQGRGEEQRVVFNLDVQRQRVFAAGAAEPTICRREPALGPRPKPSRAPELHKDRRQRRGIREEEAARLGA